MKVRIANNNVYCEDCGGRLMLVSETNQLYQFECVDCHNKVNILKLKDSRFKVWQQERLWGESDDD
jgi:DNA-directed RNA polymerase subunit RPC12/RpoP